MGWYIPYNKFQKLDEELDKWPYFIETFSKRRWVLVIFSMSVIYWACWVYFHPLTYKTMISKLSCIFLGGAVGLLFVLVVLPFLSTAGLILAWVLTNICAILFKLLEYISR